MRSDFIVFNKDIGGLKQSCCGCGACAQICPKQAISMVEDSEGFLYPQLNEEACVQCGLCESICPVQVEGHNACTFDGQQYFMATNKDIKDSLKTATIGICTILSRIVFEDGWRVCGVSLDENEWKSYHSFAEDNNDIDSFRNSKYVQSDTHQTYSETKSILNRGDKVLYIGTPCQIAGLKSYLRKDYPGLYTIDLICHGCFSHRLLKKEVEYWEKKFGGEITNFRFRSKDYYPWSVAGVVNFDVLNGNNRKHHEVLMKGSPTYHSFVKGLNLRPICYSCPFRSESRYGDLTIGDAWRLSETKTIFTPQTDKYGISSVLFKYDKRERTS